MGKKSRRPAATAVLEPPSGEIPVVGGREPCPCGSGKRYKACHGRSSRVEATRLVARPFEGLVAEGDWVALREIVPAATATVRLVDDAPGDVREVVVTSLLPMAWPALRRADGSVQVGLQTTTGSGDPSRDVAHALAQALVAEPGTPVTDGDLPGPGPRLQDLVAPDSPFEVSVHDGFDYWLEGVEDITPDVRESMERANAAVVPTRRLSTVASAYWCRIGDRRHLRWVTTHPEDALLDGLARLHAAGASALLPGTRYVGSFRADGLVVPVWDLPAEGPGSEPADLEEPAAAFAERLGEAMATDAPLTVDERRAKAGVVSRQLTLR